MILKKYNSEIPEYFKNYIYGEQLVTDLELINKLDNQLLDSINNNERNSIVLSPPEFINPDEIDSFYFTRNFPDKIQEIELGCYLDINDLDRIVGNEMQTIEDIKRIHIGYKNLNEKIIYWLYSLYNCLDLEIIYGEQNYLFYHGFWYCINIDDINKYDAIFRKNIIKLEALPPAKPDEHEGEYNMRTVKSNDTCILMDRKLILPHGEKSSVEFCDILNSDKQIIHAKKSKGSSYLSHLFSQGIVSATLFLDNERFRIDLQEQILYAILERNNVSIITRELINIVKSHMTDHVINKFSENEEDILKQSNISIETFNQIMKEVEQYHCPIPREEIKPSDFTIVYAIIGKFSDESNYNIPFFSKVNFAHHRSRLKKMGYKTAIALIPVV